MNRGPRVHVLEETPNLGPYVDTDLLPNSRSQNVPLSFDERFHKHC